MMVSRQVKELDKPLIQNHQPTTARNVIQGVRSVGRAYSIRLESILILFGMCDSYLTNYKPMSLYGVLRLMSLNNSNSNRVWKMLECMIDKGLVEVVSMGNVHKYYIPTDKALEQISPLLR